MENRKSTGYPSIDKPWLKYYSQEAIEIPLPNCTMYEFIFRNNEDNFNRIAVNYYGTTVTYGQMFQEISYLAGTLEKEGIKEGDIVTVCMINSPETVFLLFALNKIGAVANMVCGLNSCQELEKCITDVNSKIVFTLDSFQAKFEQIMDKTQIEKVVVCNAFKDAKTLPLPTDLRFIAWERFFEEKVESVQNCHKAEAPAVITYTGGTTGGSKGALFSSKSIIVNAQQYVVGECRLKRDNVWVQVMPLFIAYGMTFSLMVPLIVGMTIVIRTPMKDSISEICQKFKPNHIAYGPAYWEAFADEGKDIDLSYLTTPITGGDILNAAIEAKINEYLKKQGSKSPLLNGYGMTEANVAVSVNYQHAYELGSVGIPFVKNIVSAFDLETGKELKYGQKGEICIQTPSMMLGYVNNQDETDNVIKKHEDGKLWIHSGDFGYISENGFVYISGRLKRYMLYIANGIQKKIYSLDIEKVLLSHPKVDKCAVVPIHNEVTFQVAVAFIILRNGCCSETDIEDIKKYANHNLQGGYQPVQYIIIGKFPLTKVGKVDYLALEKLAEKQSEHRDIGN